jgi:heptosyltransferase-1
MRVLIVKTGALGDVVHAVPAALAFHRACPEARLDWLVEGRWAGVLAGQPFLDRVIAVDTQAARRRPFSTEAREKLWRPLAAAGPYDAAVDLQRLMKSALLTRLVRARERLGFAWSACREPLASLVLNRRARVDYVHHPIREQYLAPLSLLAGRSLTLPPPPYLTVDPGAAGRLAGQVGPALARPYLVALLGSGFGTKLWPEGHWADLLARLTPAWPVLLPHGGPAEEAAARRVAAAVGGSRAPFPVIPPSLDLPELMALLAGARLVLGGDTGPLHLAAALGAPTLSLYGPTLARRNAPPGGRALQSPRPCAGCVKRRCPQGQADCLAAIGPEEVAERMAEELG